MVVESKKTSASILGRTIVMAYLMYFFPSQTPGQKRSKEYTDGVSRHFSYAEFTWILSGKSCGPRNSCENEGQIIIRCLPRIQRVYDIEVRGKERQKPWTCTCSGGIGR